MIWRALGVAALVLALTAATAMAAASAGPRLAAVKVSTGKPPRIELLTMSPAGGGPLKLAGGGRRARPRVNFLSPFAWSPDGATVAFSGIVAFRDDGDEEISKLFTVGADGKGLRPIAGTKGAAAPVFAPDGRTVAFTRPVQEGEPVTVAGKRYEEGFEGATIWTVDLLSGVRRQLTPWRDGLQYTASSFSPDGATLLATVEDDRLTYEPRPVALSLDGSIQRGLADDGSSPVYSPDGSRIAFVRRVADFGPNGIEDFDLFMINADGTGLRRLIRTPGLVEWSPTWDPSGQRLAYVRLPLERGEDAPFGRSTSLMQINADGTCPTELRSARTFYLALAWQPGPDRGAGRIEC